ncbi:hypothetical protein [Maribacter sp. 2304DJ31-5]|uniref:hypothetical protein n=1 Tax=Maribacter sp. 2304DJ31-5 TaxID=3386273 RepID=UPI0039BCDB64
MKKIILLLSLSLTSFLSCSKANDTLDAFDSAGCISTLVRLSNNDDDLSCSELNRELDKLERDCSRFLDEDSRASIAVIKALCQDN